MKKVIICLGLALSTPLWAATYITTFTGTTVGSPDVTSVQLTWSTSAPFGSTIDQTALTDLSIVLFDSTPSAFYTDVVIVGGVVQNLSGADRVFWGYDFTALVGQSVTSFDNFTAPFQPGATGTTYNIYTNGSSEVDVDTYVNGAALGGGAAFSVTGQNTILVPEPSTYAAVAGLLGLGLAVYRRRRA